MAVKTTLGPFTTCLLVTQLLLLRAAATAAVVTIPGAGDAAPPAAATTVGGGLPLLPFPGGTAPGADCLKAVQQAESCAGDVLRSLASPGDAARVGQACCGVLQAVGDSCFRGVLPVSPLRALFAPLVKHACGGLSPSLVPAASRRG